MRTNYWKAAWITLAVLLGGLLYFQRSTNAQFGTYKVDVTKVNPILGASLPSDHVLGFSCISETDVHGDKEYIHSSSDTTCYVLTAHHGY